MSYRDRIGKSSSSKTPSSRAQRDTMLPAEREESRGSAATEGGPTELPPGASIPSERSEPTYTLTAEQENSWALQSGIIRSEATAQAKKFQCLSRRPLASMTSRRGEATRLMAPCMRGTCQHCKPLRAAKVATEKLRGLLALDLPVALEDTTKKDAGTKVNYHGSKLGRGAVAFPTGTDDESPSTLVTTYRSPRASARERQRVVPPQELGLALFHLAMGVPATPTGDLGNRITPNAVLRKAIQDTAPPKKPSRWRFLHRAARDLVATTGAVMESAVQGFSKIVFHEKIHARMFNAMLRLGFRPRQNPYPRPITPLRGDSHEQPLLETRSSP